MRASILFMDVSLFKRADNPVAIHPSEMTLKEYVDAFASLELRYAREASSAAIMLYEIEAIDLGWLIQECAAVLELVCPVRK